MLKLQEFLPKNINKIDVFTQKNYLIKKIIFFKISLLPSDIEFKLFRRFNQKNKNVSLLYSILIHVYFILKLMYTFAVQLFALALKLNKKKNKKFSFKNFISDPKFDQYVKFLFPKIFKADFLLFSQIKNISLQSRDFFLRRIII